MYGSVKDRLICILVAWSTSTSDSARWVVGMFKPRAHFPTSWRLLYVLVFFPRTFKITLKNPVAYGPSKQEMGGDAAPDAFIASRMVVGEQVNMKFLKWSFLLQEVTSSDLSRKRMRFSMLLTFIMIWLYVQPAYVWHGSIYSPESKGSLSSLRSQPTIPSDCKVHGRTPLKDRWWVLRGKALQP